MAIIALGADHAGYSLKEKLKTWLAADGHRVIDHGTHSTESVDYPDYAAAVAETVRAGDAERGVLVCGSGPFARRGDGPADLAVRGLGGASGAPAP